MSDGQEQTEQLLIVIGASAGGIDALERLVNSLPADFAAPIVIAQHLDPSHPSRLEEILQGRTALRVTSVGAPANLAPGTVYVVPAGQHVEILDGKVGVSQKRASRPQPSIDLLFASGAASYGERTVGVVLSGTGSDGAAGVEAIKEAGGTVIVQDPTSAAYPSLPASIPPNVVDLITPIDSLAAVLTSIVADGDRMARGMDHDMLRAFLTQLRARSGIDFTQYKTPTIMRRLSRLMAAARCNTLAEYMRYLNGHPEAYTRLVSSFLIKVTGFFRDPALYKYLREHMLPETVESARKNKTELRLWSAGCATGEEPYSLAILLAELLGDRLDEIDIRIFATDLDGDSIAFARRGVYPTSAFADMPKDLLAKYFTKIDDSYQVKKRIRNLTVFGEYDLGQRAPFPRIDMILCRNVLIYFTKELQQRTLQLFAFSLREGGYLVLGKAETTSPLPQYFSSVHPMLKVFRRHGDRLLMPAPAFGENAMVHDRVPGGRRAPGRNAAIQRRSEPVPRVSLTDRLGTVLFESSIGLVLVDRNYDIQSINQSARHLLGIHGQGIGDDVIHLSAGISAQRLKALLDSAFRGEALPNEQEFESTDAALNETKYLRIACHAEKDGGEDGISAVIMLVEDVTTNTVERRRFDKEGREQRDVTERLTKQNRDLLERQRALIDANTELTAANNELRTANEHLMIAAEEAEASAEEVETLNEEMQATSEELETLNEELQATVEELNTTNEELGARGHELERLANDRQERLAEAERVRALLEAGIEQAPVAAAVVDANGIVLKTSAQYEALRGSDSALPAAGTKWREPSPELKQTIRVDILQLGGPSQDGKLVLLSPAP